MPLIGIIAKKRDVKAIKKDFKEKKVEIVEITKESIKNIRNVKFDEIIFLQNIILEQSEYKYMKEIILKAKYVILNGDIEIDIINKMNLPNTVKLITFGFNSESTITISSVSSEKTIVYLQTEIENDNGKLIESQEKKINSQNNKNIYNKLVVFIINELHNCM